MKKIIVLLVVMASCFSVNSQIWPFSDKKVQDQANDKLGYVYDYLRSDSIVLKSIMLRDTTMRIGMMHDALGAPLLVILSKVDFDNINEQVEAYAADSAIVGLEFHLTYMDNFSWVTKKELKKINDPYQKKMTKVFNDKVKYILMQKGSRAVNGKRIVNPASPYYGQIIPDFGSIEENIEPTKVVESKKQEIKKDETKKVETPKIEKKSQPVAPPPKKRRNYDTK
jgi:hypothetical protein